MILHQAKGHKFAERKEVSSHFPKEVAVVVSIEENLLAIVSLIVAVVAGVVV
jgi:hypothetical protein